MKSITRRDFLKKSGMALGTAGCCARAMGILGSDLVYAQSKAGNGNTLVVLRLDGGNDPMNSFAVPYATSAYATSRPNIALTSALPCETNRWAMHPSLANLRNRFLGGTVAVIPEYGTMAPSYSHEIEQDTFSTGFKNNDSGTGLLGRVIDQYMTANGAGSVTQYNTLTLNQGLPPDALCTRALNRPISIGSLASASLANDETDGGSYNNDNKFRQMVHQDLLDVSDTPNDRTKTVQLGAESMYQSIATLQQANVNFQGVAPAGSAQAAYGNNTPGRFFRDSAALIKAGLGTQIILGGMGGFDLHSDLGNEAGNEANLMSQIDVAINTFFNDLTLFGKANNVTVVIDSEFGRNVRENSTEGLDHGTGGVCVVIGGSVNGGYRANPHSSSIYTAQANVIPITTHFPNVYAEVFKWLGLISSSTNPPSGLFQDYTVKSLGLLA